MTINRWTRRLGPLFKELETGRRTLGSVPSGISRGDERTKLCRGRGYVERRGLDSEAKRDLSDESE